ncbi:HD_domain domain-containing protein [Ruminococcaceae bacterium BL-6]|nr:HD_domain domain-containing protein [Ruminococcaceae bacterium BL-6]
MTNEEKVGLFSKEIGFIKNSNIQDFVKKALVIVPEYFFSIPASSTGKFHPSYALGEGGLVRHTKAAVRIANELLRLEMYGCYTQEEKDLMIAALILHDTYKLGLNHSKYTVTEHPIIAADFCAEDQQLNNIIPKEQRIFIANCVKTHMGQWTQDYRSHKEVLEKPKTKYQKFVHQCDYLASRKCLEFNFDV